MTLCDGRHFALRHGAVSSPQHRMTPQEIPMTALIKKTGSRMTRLFRWASKAGGGHWYECGGCSRGM
jgi:hypothetical protein